MKKRMLLLSLIFILCVPHSLSAVASSDWDALDQEAEKRAENAIEITEGDFFDLVSSFCQGAIITDYQDGSLSVDFSDIIIAEDAEIEMSALLLAARIIGEGAMDYCDSLSFVTLQDGTYTYLSIKDFNSFSDFESDYISLDSSGDSNASVAAKILYTRIFYNFDRLTHNTQALNDIAEEFGQETEALEDINNDFWWAYSSYDLFDPDKVKVYFSDNTAILNYFNVADTYDDGYKVWSDLLRSVNRFSQLYNSDPGGLSFYTIDVVCLQEGTNDHLFELKIERKQDGSWETMVANYYGEEFKKGVEAANQ